jgi:hypothetical protein
VLRAGKNWVMGLRLSLGAVVGLRIAAASVNGPWIFSSASICCLCLSSFFLRMLKRSHTSTNTTKTPPRAPIAMPAFTATFISPSPPSASVPAVAVECAALVWVCPIFWLETVVLVVGDVVGARARDSIVVIEIEAVGLGISGGNTSVGVLVSSALFKSPGASGALGEAAGINRCIGILDDVAAIAFAIAFARPRTIAFSTAGVNFSRDFLAATAPLRAT